MKVSDSSISAIIKNFPIQIGHITIMPKSSIMAECYFVISKSKVYGKDRFYCSGGEIAFYLADLKTGSSDFIGNRDFISETTGIKEVDNEIKIKILEYINKDKQIKKEIEEITK